MPGSEGWATTTDLAVFESVAGDLLRTHPVGNTILLTTAETLRAGDGPVYGDGEPWYGWWTGPDGQVGSAFLQTPPYPLVLAEGRASALESLVDKLVGVDRVNAEQRAAEALAAHWNRRIGADIEVHQHIRLYRLGELTRPDPAPAGRARPAVADRPRPPDRVVRGRSSTRSASRRPTRGGRWTTGWATAGSWCGRSTAVPVSMAGRTRPAAGMLRVGPVFTPLDLRGRGYAGAVTAAVSRAAQDLVGEVLLFTDMANPTSNAIYQRLGYRRVADRLQIGPAD